MDLHVPMLTRRARYEGASVQVRLDGNDDWQDHADPVGRLERGEAFGSENSPADYLALAELNGLFPRAGFWHAVATSGTAAPGMAKLAGIDVQTAQHVFATLILGFLLMSIVLEEEEWLGPATTAQIRNGRIPLHQLLKPDPDEPGTQP